MLISTFLSTFTSPFLSSYRSGYNRLREIHLGRPKSGGWNKKWKNIWLQQAPFLNQVGSSSEKHEQKVTHMPYIKRKVRNQVFAPLLDPLANSFSKLLATNLTAKMRQRVVPDYLPKCYDQNAQCEYELGEARHDVNNFNC